MKRWGGAGESRIVLARIGAAWSGVAGGVARGIEWSGAAR